MEDTDTLLALLSSLLDHPISDHAVLLDALVKHDGNVEKAARYLSRENMRGKRQAQKRKRTASLDDWLSPCTSEASPSGTRSKNTSKLPSKRAAAASSASAKSVQDDLIPSSSTRRASSSSHGKTSRETSISLSGSPCKVKPVTNNEFMNILRHPNSSNSSKPVPPKFPPLTLGTPVLVSDHTPCTLHPSILPSELACRLFYTMMNESRDWKRNKWWLFDRVVESPHRTSFYARGPASGTESPDLQEAAQYWYNGRPTAPPSAFPPAMEEACEIIERVVNGEMGRRKRFPLEWGGAPPDIDNPAEVILWRANVAAANRYEGTKESVGFHSDQLTNLGPYPTIASLSLGTSRVFRLREVIPSNEKDKRSARTYNIPLQHNSLVIMHASCQETFKHAVPPQNTIDLFHPPFPPPPSLFSPEDVEVASSNSRINITFRFYRPDYRAELTPRCRCGVPCILRPDMKNRYTDNNATSGTSGERNAEPPSTKKDIVAKYWWTCYAGAQNEGKGCNFWKVMDVTAEGRGPFVEI